MRPPTFGELEQFCQIDGWKALQPTTHQPYRKVLLCPTGSIPLTTHVSFNRASSPNPGVWRAILREQLACTESDFWTVLRTKQPLERPCPPEVEPAKGPQLPPTFMKVLAGQLHLSAEEISQMTTEEARAMVQEFWARPR